MRMTAIAVLALALLASSPAVAADCDIIATVMAIEKIEKSAWQDGAPSSFSTVETRITIRISGSAPHAADSKSACATTPAAETKTYKLCSPTPVKAGNIIRATEGMDTGANSALGCLFDISVQQQQP
jgi:hypothetical protein